MYILTMSSYAIHLYRPYRFILNLKEWQKVIEVNSASNPWPRYGHSVVYYKVCKPLKYSGLLLKTLLSLTAYLAEFD